MQAAPLYVTLWYKRNELASRIGILFSMQALAGSFNGLIAYGIETNLNGALGVAAWQWIFLIEGTFVGELISTKDYNALTSCLNQDQSP